MEELLLWVARYGYRVSVEMVDTRSGGIIYTVSLEDSHSEHSTHRTYKGSGSDYLSALGFAFIQLCSNSPTWREREEASNG